MMKRIRMTRGIGLMVLLIGMLSACSADGDLPPGSTAGGDPGGDGGGGDGGGTPTLTCVEPIGGIGAQAVGSASGLCLGCGVSDPGLAIDDDPDSYATISLPVGLLGGSASLAMTAPPGVAYPAGNEAGVTLAVPAGLLSLELLQSVSLEFRLDDVTVDTVSDTALLSLSALGIPIIGGSELMALSAPAGSVFDGVQLTVSSGLANLLSTVQVYGGCGRYATSGSAAAR